MSAEQQANNLAPPSNEDLEALEEASLSLSDYFNINISDLLDTKHQFEFGIKYNQALLDFESQLIQFIKNDEITIKDKTETLLDASQKILKLHNTLQYSNLIKMQDKSANNYIKMSRISGTLGDKKEAFELERVLLNKKLKVRFDVITVKKNLLMNLHTESFTNIIDMLNDMEPYFIKEVGTPAQKMKYRLEQKQLKAPPPQPKKEKKKKTSSSFKPKEPTAPRELTAEEKTAILAGALETSQANISAASRNITDYQNKISKLENDLDIKRAEEYNRIWDRIKYRDRAIHKLSKHDKTGSIYLLSNTSRLLKSLTQQNCDVSEYQARFDNLYLNFEPPLSKQEYQSIFRPTLNKFKHVNHINGTKARTENIDTSDIEVHRDIAPDLYASIVKSRMDEHDATETSKTLRLYETYLDTLYTKADRSIQVIQEQQDKLTVTKDTLRSIYLDLLVIKENPQAYQRLVENFNEQAKSPPLSGIRAWAKDNLTHVFITETALRTTEAYDYEKPEIVYECLTAMNRFARDLAELHQDPDCDEACRKERRNNIMQTFNNAVQVFGVENTKTLGKKNDQERKNRYLFQVGGKTRQAEMHLKKGVGFDNRKLMRIYYDLDEKKGEVYIGHMPEHL